MKCICVFFVSFCCIVASLKAENLIGRICDETNTPISGVNVSICTSGGGIVAVTQTTARGSFILHNVEAGKYTLLCSYMGYSEYTADIKVSHGQDLDVGTLIMFERSIQLNETRIVARRNVFTTDKQIIYPSDQQVEASGNGLDLLKKQPIPLLQVNPINRTIASLDPLGDVALFINDIPADANEFSIVDPKQVKRIDVIRNPGAKYGSNLAIVINLVLKQARNGAAIGVNTTNSAKIINGYNNVPLG